MNNKFKNVITFGGFIIGGIIILLFTSIALTSKNDIIFANSKDDNLEAKYEVEDLRDNYSYGEKIFESGNIKNKQENIEEVNENQIYIHVLGAVNFPGIVKAKEGIRVYEAIEQAGGITEDADLGWINLASKIYDGDRIIVPYKVYDEAGKQISIESQINNIIKREKNNLDLCVKGYLGDIQSIISNSLDENAKESDKKGVKININTADLKTLETLDGIGSSTASKIIEYREKIGEFKSIDELKNVSGIGDKKLNIIRNNITT